MRGRVEFAISSRLNERAETVWQRAVTLRGVNDELWPVVMSAPREAGDRSIADAPVGEWMFRSLVSLLGILPLDLHHFRIESIGPGFRFQESSESLIARQWRHQRRVEPAGSGCRLTDQLVIELRVPFLAPLLAPVYKAIFTSRHRKLKRWYGSA